MKIQITGEQMQLKTGGLTVLFLGISFLLAGGFVTILPFLGWTSDNGESVPKWASIVGLLFVVIGIFAGLYAKRRVITLVKNGESNITDTKLIGGGVESQNFHTSDIAAVNLATRNEYVNSSDQNGGGGMERVSYLNLRLKDNSTIEVCSSNQGGFSFNGMNIGSLISKAPLSREAEQIATFLGVPVKYEDANSFQSLKDAITGKNQPENTTPPINPDASSSVQPQSTEVNSQPESSSTDDRQVPPQNDLK